MEEGTMDIVLVIGERPERARALAERLGIHGVEAIPCARDWKLVHRSLLSHDVSLVTVDIDRSQASARFFELLKELVAIPVLVMGLRNDPDRFIWYLDHGAVDYIPRSTPDRAVAAKIMSLLRTMSDVEPTASIRVGNLTIDLDSYSVSRAGAPVPLTPIEFRLLRVLAENAGRACSRGELLERVWGEDFRDCSHYLRLYMGYLRNKLEDNPRRPKVLMTEWGYGYRLVGAERRGSLMKARAAMRIVPSG